MGVKLSWRPRTNEQVRELLEESNTVNEVDDALRLRAFFEETSKREMMEMLLQYSERCVGGEKGFDLSTLIDELEDERFVCEQNGIIKSRRRFVASLERQCEQCGKPYRSSWLNQHSHQFCAPCLEELQRNHDDERVPEMRTARDYAVRTVDDGRAFVVPFNRPEVAGDPTTERKDS